MTGGSPSGAQAEADLAAVREPAVHGRLRLAALDLPHVGEALERVLGDLDPDVVLGADEEPLVVDDAEVGVVHGAQSGRRPPGLIVFIVNCEVMRARPGRSANVLIRKCS